MRKLTEFTACYDKEQVPFHGGHSNHGKHDYFMNAEIFRCWNTRAIEQKFDRFEVVPLQSAAGNTLLR